MQEYVKSPPLDGVYVSGLCTEGFVFKEIKNREIIMDDCPPDGKVFNHCPIIHFLPQLKHYIYNPDVLVPMYMLPQKKGKLSTTG